MKQQTAALLLSAALALSLLGASALAAGEEASGQDAPAAQSAAETQADPSAAQPEAQAQPEVQGEEPEDPEDSGLSAQPEASVEEYIPDPVGSITFGNLKRRMHEGNLQVLALQESIGILEEIDYEELQEDLRVQLNQMAQMQWMMAQMGQKGTLAYEQMDQAYSAVREQFETIKDGDMQADNADTIRQLKNLQNQIVMAGEATYIALSAMEIQEDGLERQLTALDRQLEELELRYQLGHISSQTLKQTQAGRTALTSGLETLRMNLNTYKGQLELLIGADVTGGIALGALPSVSRAEVNAMDLEKDLETAKANSWDIYQATETMKEELKKFNNMGGEAAAANSLVSDNYRRVRHNWYNAKYTYDNTVQNFGLSLRNLYLKVKDCQQILDASNTALAVEQDNRAAAQLKHSQGTISQNALLEAEDKVKEAREKVASAENDLFSSYNTYRWAVDYGIIN